MGALKPVELERRALVGVDELLPEFPLRKDGVRGEVLHPGRETYRITPPDVVKEKEDWHHTRSHIRHARQAPREREGELADLR